MTGIRNGIIPSGQGRQDEAVIVEQHLRIVEDVSPRDIQYAIKGWTEAVRAMQGARPTLQQTVLIVSEAELWMARVRLMRAGKLRLVRWHAMGRG
jgi:hypothetical protein